MAAAVPGQLPRWRVLWLDNRLDCRVWAYYCELRRAFGALHNLSNWGNTHSPLRTLDPQLIVVGPRFTTNLHTADTALGVSRQRYSHVPLVVLQNKVYSVSEREYTGNLSAKLEWTRAIGAAAGFTWLTRHGEFTQRSGVPHHRLPFAADPRLYGQFAGNFSGQVWDVGFTGSLTKKYSLRERVMEGLRKMPDIRAYLKSWSKAIQPGDASWGRLRRIDYVRQIASSKMWVSTTGPDWIVGTRYFEVMMSGTTLLLCNRPPPGVSTYDGLFEDGVHVVMFDGVQDLRKKIKYYLNDEPARRRIVSAARELALSRHTWQSRAAFITQVAQKAIENHPSGVAWYQGPGGSAAADVNGPVHNSGSSVFAGCFVEKASLIERTKKAAGAQKRRAVDSNATLVEQKRPDTISGPYRIGFRVQDCEEACAGHLHFGLICGGFCSGDSHRRARCYCGRPRVLKAMVKHRAQLKCSSTCSLHDERPCGGPGAFAMYSYTRAVAV